MSVGLKAPPLESRVRCGHLLLIEDDARIARLITTELTDAQFELEWAASGQLGLDAFGSRAPSLLILDLNLPDIDGLDLCSKIRLHNRLTPILMLTARASRGDVVRGLELGADDYMSKPFDSLELIARIRALLRRVDAHHELTIQRTASVSDQTIRQGTLLIDPITRKVCIRSQNVELTAKEFDLLLLFAKHPGRVFTREDLLKRLWGSGFDGFEHTVNTHINRLRSKIEADAKRPVFIETAWGIGYRFAVQSAG